MQHKTAAELIAFKERIRAIWASGEMPFMVHFSGGNEEQLIEIFKEAKDGDWFLGSHRAHYHYLLAGGTEAELEAALRNGESMHLFNKRTNFMTSSILAGMAPIAVGIAMALKESGSPNRVWQFIGDGATDSGHFYEAAMFTEGHALPLIFVVEDNDCSVDTNKRDRRGPHSVAIYEQLKCVRKYSYISQEPHCGPGLKTNVVFNPKIVAKHAKGVFH
jgi:pyruvate dehydrogenase E1 component alpha subunit